MFKTMNNVKIHLKPSSLPKTVQKLTINPHQGLESPIIDLKLNLLPSSTHSRTRITQQHSKTALRENQTQENHQMLLTERSNTINEFTITPHSKKGSNIKSYLRLKPNLTNYMPFQIHNNQSIVCDRAVYKFDYIFNSSSTQRQIYEQVGKQVTLRFLEGYNGTIFAYGSTGSGKTYTMFGFEDGLVPLVVQEVFSGLEKGWELGCSMIEIYKENLIDLLSTDNDLDLKIKEDNNSCSIQNLSIVQVTSQSQTMRLIKKGNILKKIRQTHLNQCSSRSHVVFSLHLSKQQTSGKSIRCKFNLVDLAGSQKVFKSKVQGQGLEQAKKINLSLSCLGNTISALIKNSDHIPYRESKLTRILKESLMGNSITRLIVTCALNEESMEESISSIKFAQRAQKVQTQAEIAYNITKFKEEKEELQRLQSQTLRDCQETLQTIKQIVDQSSSCCSCAEIKGLLSKKNELPNNLFVTYNYSQNLKSPKSRFDLKNYFTTNSNSRAMSIQKRQSSIKSIQKHNQTLEIQNKDTINKKIFVLQQENEQLKKQKIKLEIRIKVLEEKLIPKEKKVIRLGQGKNQKQIKENKENEAVWINIDQPGRNQGKQKAEILKVNGNQISSKDLDKTIDLQTVNTLIKQIISKLETACQEYRKTIYPLQLQILNEQLQYYQQPISVGFRLNIAKEFDILLKIKKRLCQLTQDLPECFQKLLEQSTSEYKEEVSELLKMKLREISQIKWSTKELTDQSSEMSQLHSILDKQNNCINDKNTTMLQVDSLQSQLSASENEFLKMDIPCKTQLY